MRKEGERVNIVGVKYVAPVELAGTLVIGEIERVRSTPKIVGYLVDLVRVGVCQLYCQTVAIFHAYASLQRVVTEVAFVRFLRNGTEPWENSVVVRCNGTGSNALPKVIGIARVIGIGQWQGINGNIQTLVPASASHVLHHRNNRLSQLALHAEAEHQCPRNLV